MNIVNPGYLLKRPFFPEPYFNTVKPSLVYVPFFTCDGLLEPFAKAGTRYEFYAINEQPETEHLPHLKRICISFV
jgi:hypothetical protein